MSAGPSPLPERTTTGAGSPGTDPRREFTRGRWIVRGVALLYAAWMFGEPAYRHGFAAWMEAAALYAAFLALFFLVALLSGGRQIAAFAGFFLFVFLYYPFHQEANAVFLYPFAMLCLSVRRLSALLVVLAAFAAPVVTETHFLGHPLSTAEGILLACFIIGFTNFGFAQQERANHALERANSEIERLTQEAERERIARDLHDLLGHTLTAITVKLDLARRLLARDPDRARTEIVEAEQTARHALAEVREAVSGYRAEGLDVEISRARRTLLSARVRLTTTLAPVPLTPGQVTVLCLALREAVTNIVRHAHATLCRVALFAGDSTVHLTIEDDGCGGPVREGNGLRGMRERLHSVQGTLHLASLPQGTRLELTLPLDAASPAPAAYSFVEEANLL